ncbi:hypothetical protein GCM10017608_23030 [Agromyces luteolus]|uniref:Lipoprotein n=1 Tax=Agromyces luteolus TaxID=88373 RepID=A0A7C9HHJ7_9MICO|nr:hypothetical protein [Agromyces luteolus]MUN07023.1 hypothetical protein [Agromyces luteolus]GLK28369.1 hypothetical protein GCM10017608_23030 [Agromyces luteolus]
MRATDSAIAVLVAAACLATMAACGVSGPGGGPTPSTPGSVETASPDPTSPPTGAPTATPLLTHVEWNEPSGEVIASGLVDGSLDDAVDCEFEFSIDGAAVSRTATPQPGPSSLDCGSVFVPGDELGPGAWTIVLRYGDARSDEATVEVPE